MMNRMSSLVAVAVAFFMLSMAVSYCQQSAASASDRAALVAPRAIPEGLPSLQQADLAAGASSEPAPVEAAPQAGEARSGDDTGPQGQVQ
jgi:hypothetical protein